MFRAFNPGGVKEFILHTMIGYGYFRYYTLDIKVRLSFTTTHCHELNLTKGGVPQRFNWDLICNLQVPVLHM